MDTIRTGKQTDKLRRRREQVAMTLRHIAKEQREVEQNTDWLDQAAYESRVKLLDRLSEWYVTEADQIDRALERIKKNYYGICMGCRHPIESERLESYPEAEFCSACQEAREGLQTA